MSTPGPKPIPRNLRVLIGGRSASPDRMRQDEPKPKVKVPRPPRDLDPQERRYWREFTSRIAELNCTSAADVGAILIWVKARRRWKAAFDNVDRYGMLIQGGTLKNPQPRRNPLLSEIHKCEATMLRIETEFGMTPSSRSRVSSNNNDGN
jgi:P27 family predicted phage terminase small subunit